MKIGMISLMGNQPQRLSSHNAGWTFALKEILTSKYNGEVYLLKQTDDINRFDMIVINNGINFTAGAWNFIGGPPETLAPLLQKLSTYKGKLISFNHKVDLANLVEKRKEFADLKGTQFPDVELHSTLDNGKKLIIGDSHSLSVYRPDWGISRNDGKTLFGALRNDGEFIRHKIDEAGDIDSLHLYFGNIDVRFHLMRQPNPKEATLKLVRDYVEFVVRLSKGYDLDVTIQGLIPIEDENRKLPGSGKHNGNNFYGTQEERQELVDYFNLLLRKNSFVGYYNFEEWDFEAPLSFDLMESRQSVHIRPEFYYFEEFTNKFKPQVAKKPEQKTLF